MDLLPDICDQFEDRVQLIDVEFKDFGGRACFYGEIVTVRCYQDNSLVREVLQQNGKGKVLFIDGNGSCQKALLGDQVALLAVNNQWEGVIVYGAIRDVGEIRTMPLGVKALGTSPFKTEKRGAGEQQVSITVNTQVIPPGDYIYADLNGVLISKELLI
ncbi:putative 4-hydroxy-4-methyl-2-oxoglutarate aldolase [Aliivibrio salmonicida]|jgi:regulator of ribonuclease activity A|uniref:4-hydroxy-4-methyl-2-oxoglutarate aldolase n=1 Tax=Aliivibrio salmonicida (strain LFI1238) TaxID=316275 RepID=B6EKY9_ALISL|nr:putative 4-hydroxy-4-methyl-2-oxoglutarate aldolase [Aliivibrio salmonicida]AZL85678.1 putative 4-hydroxy-4-methyl-2-oxoglutarate aldolase [Aliivibrio salmonicida]CAQ80241.1 demethylmenaquinone methyltransferase [Aliivibrio salmonicida LFI1238]